MKHFIAIFFILVFSLPSKANIPIHYLPTEDPGDARLVYILELLKLSLSKSAPNETIEFIPLPAVISYARAIHELKRDSYPNYFTPGGVNIELLGTDNLQAVDFPLDHGLLSYRICFVSHQAKRKVTQINSIEELRQFTIAQGTNWPDVSILKKNGFKVVEVPLYTSLFKMVVSNRVDLVCRGMNELRSELKQFKHYGKLTYDKSFVLIYTMPYKLYFNKSSAELIAKIELGLAMAKQDGSLDKLFKAYFADDLAFAKLSQRKRFVLTTGYENSFSDHYKQYLYNPFQ
ncbi:MAG: transporter substrate-binding domain-containing protein [Cellvibrio sp.]|jgi:ABC-type amino acid transport substrate-binding protein|nr:transporter substrate-binding domain-containing protein [Cellvibrio sp.]